MKIRIIGTSSTKYVSNFQKIRTLTNHDFVVRGEEIRISLFDRDNKPLMSFSKNKTTWKQNIEVWLAFGLISLVGDHYKFECGAQEYEIVDKAKKSLLFVKANDNKIQQIRNSKLLILEWLTSKVSDDDLVMWKITQSRGELTINKLAKECSQFERDLVKDTRFISRYREVLYGIINTEL